jgi:hypothetical protein
MKHVVNPLSAPAAGFTVHAWQEGASHTLCSHLPAYMEYKGKRTIRVLETVEPLDCVGCGKALEVLARQQMRHLSGPGIEKVLELIASMRNGDVRE